MFSKPADTRLLQNRFFLLGITTLLLFLLQLCFLLLLLVSIKVYLQQNVMRQLETSYNHFIDTNRDILRAPDIYGSILDQQSFSGLTFVRIIRENEQLLFTASTEERLNFKDLARLDPAKQGCWLSLFEDQDPSSSGVWNLLSDVPIDTIMVQVGSRDKNFYAIYKKLVGLFGVAVIPAFLVALFIGLTGHRLSLVPLAQLRERLGKVRSGEGDLSSLAASGSREQQEIFNQIDMIIMQNRQLVTEMQESLDNVAHDLRTPMTRLRSVAEYGLQAGDDREKLQSALSDCLEEADRVLAMLKIMMSVAEAETGMMKLDYRTFELSSDLADIVELYAYSAEDEKVQVILEAGEQVWLEGDKTRLSQVWANLLDNAIKYNRSGGTVKIEAIADGGLVKVSFSDSGIGISDQEKEKIWERLYRGDRSRSRQGLGLGLNYVRAVVEAHQGVISVESSLNKGSTFTVELPAEQKKDSGL